MYQALYRKYRPQSFEDVVGQKHITDTLKAQLLAGKMSHAYLFTGTRGTGKTTCAKILAKAVNCLDSHDGNPCNQCEACRAIDDGACVDVLEIDAASNNGVDHVRALRDEAVYSPSQVKKRVYIVDEVHMLSTSAFNALLKIIEEPPEHLLFILATTELHKVPATILSRCQRFSFRRLQAGDISNRLNYVAYEEGLDLQPDAANLLSILADGALRDGLSLLDQCASSAKGAITADTVCGVLGLAGQMRTASLLDAIADNDANRALNEFTELYTAGKDLSAMVSEMATLARDLLIMRTAPQGGKGLLSGISTEQDRQALLKKLSPARLLHMVSTLQKTASGFSVSANPRLDTELCIMQLCSPALCMDAEALSARIGQLEEKLAAGKFTIAAAPAPAEEPALEAQPIPAPMQQAPAEVKETAAPVKPMQSLPNGFWPEFLVKLRTVLSPALCGFFAANVRPELQGNILYLLAETPFVYEMIATVDYTALSEKASFLLGRPVTVRPGQQGANKTDGADAFQELLQFGSAHRDVITIKDKEI